MATIGLSRTVSEINGDSVFCAPVELRPVAPLRPRPLRTGYQRRGSKKTRMIDGRRKKFDDIFSCLDTIHELDGKNRQSYTAAKRAKTALTHVVAR